MRKHNLVAGLVLLALLTALLPPAWGSESETFHIYNASDWLQLVKNCAYDGWSEGRTVILERDISLAGAECRPIPSFGGVFQGGGHTISQFSLTDQFFPAGLFGTIAPQGEVLDLKVGGAVIPEGSGQQVGGLAGVNRGTIQNCTFTGTVEGRGSVGGLVGENASTGLIRLSAVEGGVFGGSMAGGVVGKNCGTVNSCESRCYVNTRTVDPSITLADLNLDAWTGLRRLMSPDTFNVNTDSGGIAGYSEGFLLNCTNRGTVGYQHIGYNQGGVVGRNRGHVYGCVNTGRVYGRLGVGGVAGLAEPDVILDLSESSLNEIRSKLTGLNDLVDKATRNGDASSEAISARLTALGDRVETSETLAQNLTDQLTGYWDDTVEEINRGSEILDGAIDRLGDVTEGFRDAAGTLTAALDALDRAAAILQKEGAFDQAQDMAMDVRLASENLEESLTQARKAMDRLRGAVKSSNGSSRESWRKQMDQGIDQTWAGVSQTLQALTDIHSLLSGVSASLEAGELPSFSGLRDAFRSAADGLDQTRRGLSDMGAATDVSFSDFDRGLDELQEALFTLSQGKPGEDGGAFFYLSKAMEELEALAATGERSFEPLHEGIGLLRDASGQMTAALDKAVDLTDYLRDQDRLTFQSLGERADGAADELYDSLHSISGELEGLNDEVKGASDQLTQDVRAINAQFNSLMNTLLDVVQEVEDAKAEDVIQDTSEEDMEAVTLGKIAHSRNEGEIFGDLNVGGIAGAMEIYNPVDPERDEPTLSSLFHRKYRLKCVLQDCVNVGAVTARRSRVGAVCGEAALGVIWGCEAQGTVESEDGDYVGGIAGRGDNVIRRCYARCSLLGRRYVGGIVGGMVEDSQSVVADCRSLVEITEASRHAGAIAGEDQGVLTGNLFVSPTLAGAGEISSRGRAQPVDYETLVQEPGLPVSFQKFTLTFRTDDKVVDSRSFQYGDSFPDLVFPPIPPKEGMYAHWDRKELENLTFDTVVTAQYHPYVTALASEQNRSGSRAAFYAEGEFDDEDSLVAVPATRDFLWPDNSLWGRIRGYHRRVLEQWRLTCPGQGEVAIRYLPPESAGGRLEVYLAKGESWERVETEKVGSCLVLRVPVQSELTILSVGTPWWVWALLGGLLLLLLAVLFLSLLVRKKKPVRQPGETPPPPDPKEIRRKKFHRNLRLGLLAASLVLAGAVVAVLLTEPVVESVEIARLVRSYSDRENLDMELALSASLDGEELGTTLSIAKRRVEERELTAIATEGITVYTCDGVILLENGKALRTNVHLPAYGSLLTSVAALYRELDVTTQEVNGVKTYHVQAAGEKAGELLAQVLPIRADPGFQEAQVDLLVVDGELSRVEAAWTSDQARVRGVLTLREKTQELTVPQPVRNVLRSGSYLEAPQVGEDLELLFTALSDLAAQEPLNTGVSLSVNCGPLILSEKLDYWQTDAYGEELTLVSRRGANLWFTQRKAALDNGLSAELGEAKKLDTGSVLELTYQALLLGETDVQKGEGYARYTLMLDPDAMTRFAAAMAPDTASLPLRFESGRLVLTVRQGKVATLSVRCEGSVSVVAAQVPASVSIRLDPASEPMPTPSEKVRAALELSRENVP